MPMKNDCSVCHAALRKIGRCTRKKSCSMTLLKGGRMKARSRRPMTSQRAIQISSD
jgi:hypothetical protein